MHAATGSPALRPGVRYNMPLTKELCSTVAFVTTGMAVGWAERSCRFVSPSRPLW